MNQKNRKEKTNTKFKNHTLNIFLNFSFVCLFVCKNRNRKKFAIRWLFVCLLVWMILFDRFEILMPKTKHFYSRTKINKTKLSYIAKNKANDSQFVIIIFFVSVQKKKTSTFSFWIWWLPLLFLCNRTTKHVTARVSFLSFFVLTETHNTDVYNQRTYFIYYINGWSA